MIIFTGLQMGFQWEVKVGDPEDPCKKWDP